ncbi:hypothetical protein SMF913_10939 [Streptomyces malaysiensis]|uniref:Uncharacterized protein n=1 Tax=Streptomyces malaysiensis TaxID=92644 RepID=A0A2J7Z3S2_STRMQ|nr:hypothetical protein SMF913_10939 [Streptomyces malaysiensis]
MSDISTVSGFAAMCIRGCACRVAGSATRVTPM